MSSGQPAPAVIHGWTVFAHPLFLAQIETLAQQVQELQQKDPAGYLKKNASKRLAAIQKLAFDLIPQDPTRPEYRQGVTLGAEHKHWFRAKFFQQYRLFFRYHSASKVIVLVWVNDAGTQCAYESDTDAYRVFRKMLDSAHPPNDWAQLLAEATGVNGLAARIMLAPKQRYCLADMLAQCNPNAAPPADLALWDQAKPAGQEVW